jgi:hypothetical protein
MKDNFDVHSWKTNLMLENFMSDADLNAKKRVDIVYNQIMGEFSERFESSIDKSLLRFSISSAFTELALGNLNEDSKEKDFEVQYWIYKNDDYDNESIVVKAKTEEEALLKAKEEKYKGKNFKIVK